MAVRDPPVLGWRQRGALGCTAGAWPGPPEARKRRGCRRSGLSPACAGGFFSQNPHLSSLISARTTFEVPVTKAVQLAREDAIKPALLLEPGIAVSIFACPNNTFHLPADPSVPFMISGPGTGISPSIGFLQHRDELRCFLENGTLTHLKVGFSRDSSTAEAAPPKYVQDFIRLYANKVARVLLKEKSYFSICGAKKPMADGVSDAVVGILSMAMEADRLEAMKMLAMI